MNRRVRALFAGGLLLLGLWASPLFAWTEVPVHYAQGFSIERQDGQTLLEVHQPWPGALEGKKYLLVPRGEEPADVPEGATVIEIPVRTCVSTTTVPLGFMADLDVLDRLVGQGGKKYVYNPTPEQQALPEIGNGAALDVEKILALAPEVLFTYIFTDAEKEIYARLEEAGIKVVVVSEYLETHPLGRAEWHRYVARFFGLGQEGDARFEGVAGRYEELAERGRAFEEKPMVLANAPFNGTWYVPSGNSWSARFLLDAGADYPWAEVEKTGSLPMDVEVVFAEARNADFWVNSGHWNFLEDAVREEPRFGEFAPFRSGRVYNNNARVNAQGGNDYHQSGVLRADLVLEDLLSIFHPDALPGHGLLYYKRLPSGNGGAN